MGTEPSRFAAIEPELQIPPASQAGIKALEDYISFGGDHGVVALG